MEHSQTHAQINPDSKEIHLLGKQLKLFRISSRIHIVAIYIGQEVVKIYDENKLFVCTQKDIQ